MPLGPLSLSVLLLRTRAHAAPSNGQAHASKHEGQSGVVRMETTLDGVNALIRTHLTEMGDLKLHVAFAPAE